jgi:hypothetical protein
VARRRAHAPKDSAARADRRDDWQVFEAWLLDATRCREEVTLGMTVRVQRVRTGRRASGARMSRQSCRRRPPG